MLRVTPFFYRG